MNLISDLTAGEYGGYQAVLAIHAEGSIEAEKLTILAALSSVSVRSAARKRSASASDLRPSPICGPVYTSNNRTSSSSSPAPSRTAFDDALCRDRLVDNQGDVLEDRGERRHGGRRQRLAERDRVEVQLGAQVPLGRPLRSMTAG